MVLYLGFINTKSQLYIFSIVGLCLWLCLCFFVVVVVFWGEFSARYKKLD